MQNIIKPIETVYRGYRFRSRLEARWAVFFDALDIEWTYEAEGYELPSGRYLPDFFLPEHEMFVEVKPKRFSDIHSETLSRSKLYGRSAQKDIKRAAQLAQATGFPVKFACGDPLDEFCRGGHWFDYARFVVCPLENPQGAYAREEGLHRALALSGHKLEHASLAARQARFEHGETPA